MKLQDIIRQIAAHFDEKGRMDNEITVLGTRKTVMQHFKPKERGGQLFVGEHPINLVAKNKRPQLDNLDWVSSDDVQT